MKTERTLLSVLCLYLLAVSSIPLKADNYTHSAVYSEPADTYYLDRKIEETKRKNDPLTMGFLARFGYAFNYDAFTYGLSIYYQWNRLCGITAGFDGYYIPYKYIHRTLPNDTVSSNVFILPLWDVRAGFMLSRYFLFGAMLGKTNVGDASNIIDLRHDAWFINNKESNFLYGGFVTFVLPVSKHFGFNIDFAVTNKTGFNVALGLNATIPIK